MTEIGFILLGLVAGILSGLFGIGGGIIMVPSLILIFGLDILDANATSLAAMLLPVGILGVIAYRKAGLVNWRDSLWIALGLLLGSFAGGELAVSINEGLLTHFYVAILVFIALSYMDVLQYFRKSKSPAPREPLIKNKPAWTFVLVGIVAGVFAGLFGKGGGIVIIPILVGLYRFDPKVAAATSLAALQLPVGLPSILVYAENGHFDFKNASLIAVGILFGALIGSRLGVRLPAILFKRAFAVFLLAVAGYMMYKYQ